MFINKNIHLLKFLELGHITLPRPSWNYIGKFTAIFFLYFITAQIGLSLNDINKFATLAWPPSGLALGFLLMFGLRFWPAIFLSATLVSFILNAPLWASFSIGAGNTLEAVVGTYLCLHSQGGRVFLDLDKLDDVLRFIVLGAILSTMVSASIGIFTLWSVGMVSSKEWFFTWFVWWIGDALGVLIVAPLLLVFSRRGSKKLSCWNGKRVLEVLALGSLTVLLTFWIFLGSDLMGLKPARVYFFFPLLLWASLRFGQKGPVQLNFFVASIAILGAINRQGSFSGGTPLQNYFFLLSFVLIMSLTGLVLTAIVTEREKQKEDLLANKARLGAIFDSSMDGIISMDHRGKIIEFNPAAERIFGYRKEEVLGRDLEEMLIPLNDRMVHCLSLANKLIQGNVELLGRRMEFQAKNKDGNELPIEVTVTRISLSGHPIFTGYIRDITVRKQWEADLKLAKEMADAANYAKSMFLANMGHEIRTPLGIVLGFSEMLASENISSEEKLRYRDAIRRNGGLLSTVINDILDLSKVEAGKLQINKVNVSLERLIKDLQVGFEKESLEKGISLQIIQEGEVQENIFTDPLRVHQVLLNVVGNAFKFSASGGVIEVRIKTFTEAQGKKFVSFVIKDNGQGIAPEIVQKLFVPFTQADMTSKRKFGGAGLGLALSKKLARLLGGDLSLTETTLGHGSIFTFTLYSGRDYPSWINQELTSMEKDFSLTRLDGLTVLLVDDSPDNKSIMTHWLEQAGANVETAENGQEGLKKAQSEKFDLVLMDLQMPLMDGHEATVKLRKCGYTRPIVALTARAMNSDRELCLNNGFDDHLTRPIDRASLLKSLSKYCHKCCNG